MNREDISKKADEIVDQAIGYGFAGTRAQILNLVDDATKELEQKLDKASKQIDGLIHATHESAAEIERYKVEVAHLAGVITSHKDTIRGMERDAIDANLQLSAIKAAIGFQSCGCSQLIEEILAALPQGSENRSQATQKCVDCGKAGPDVILGVCRTCDGPKHTEKRKDDCCGCLFRHSDPKCSCECHV